MIRYVFLFAFAFVSCFQVSFSQTTKRALFLGNSYTFFNSLPVLVSNLATAGGDTLVYDSNTPGGYTMEAHSTNSTTLSKIAQGNWDYVTIQGQSQRPSFSPAQVAQEVYPYAQIICDSIRAANACTEPVFFMTWGRKNGDQSNCANYPPICTYEGMQTRLRTSYVQMANDNNCTVAPCGIGFWQSRLQDPNLELYNPDQSHPAYAGSYLSACVFYATFFRKSPVGLNFYGSLDSTTATFLQNIAEMVVLDSVTTWRIGANDVVAGFSSSISNDEVTFSDQSVNATSWAWDFGDGSLDSIANPVHTYTASGNYTVTLIVTDGCTSDTLTETVNVTIVGAEGPQGGLFRTAPNPSSGEFALEAEFGVAQTAEIEVWDLNGRLIYRNNWEVNSGLNRLQVDLGAIPSGAYMVKMVAQDRVESQRILVSK